MGYASTHERFVVPKNALSHATRAFRMPASYSPETQFQNIASTNTATGTATIHASTALTELAHPISANPRTPTIATALPGVFC